VLICKSSKRCFVIIQNEGSAWRYFGHVDMHARISRGAGICETSNRDPMDPFSQALHCRPIWGRRKRRGKTDKRRRHQSTTVERIRRRTGNEAVRSSRSSISRNACKGPRRDASSAGRCPITHVPATLLNPPHLSFSCPRLPHVHDNHPYKQLEQAMLA
jgi:hypothetical protein